MEPNASLNETASVLAQPKAVSAATTGSRRKRNSLSPAQPKKRPSRARCAVSQGQKRQKRTTVATKMKKAGVEEKKKLKISSFPEMIENLDVPSSTHSNSGPLLSGISSTFPIPDSNSNLNLTFDQIANELLSSLSGTNIFASNAQNISEHSFKLPSASVHEAQTLINPLQNIETFSNSLPLDTTSSLISVNSSNFEIDLSQVLMIFYTLFDVVLAPRLMLSDNSFSSVRLFVYKQLLFNDILATVQTLLFKPASAASTNNFPACISVEQLLTIFSASVEKLGLNSR